MVYYTIGGSPHCPLFGRKIIVKTLFSIDFQKEGDYKNLLQKRKRSLLITLPFFNCWVLLGVGEGESCLPWTISSTCEL
jgi:hypothetical protein